MKTIKILEIEMKRIEWYRSSKIYCRVRVTLLCIFHQTTELNMPIYSDKSVYSVSDSLKKREATDRVNKTRHDVFVAAEELKAILAALGLQTGREFPSVAVIMKKIEELKYQTSVNHSLISKLIQSEVGQLLVSHLIFSDPRL